jgi:hypothetical protein
MTAYSLDLSRVDKVSRSYDLASIFTELSGPFTAASVALLPVGAKPNGSTIFTPMTVANGQASVLYAGPDASSTGAVVVTGSCDPYIEATSGTETQAVRVPGGRITLRGGGTVPALPAPYVTSVNGMTGAVTIAGGGGGLSIVDNGDGTLSTTSSSVVDNGDGTLSAA